MAEHGTAERDGPSPERVETLQCMEIIGGNEALQRAIAAPGLDIWVDSQPLGGKAGGDIHYFSMCGSGRVTRLAVADVSGHGAHVDPMARSLRQLMRKYINMLDQTRFAQALNREFPLEVGDDYFATVLLATYFAPTDHLIICNGGHPRPLWFSQRSQRWHPLDPSLQDTGPSIAEAKGTYALRPVANLPLGVIEPTHYYQFDIQLAEGDVVLIYTDALIEVPRADGARLGEAGLLALAESIAPAAPAQVARALLDAVAAWSGHAAAEDDQTLIVLRHNASDPPRMNVKQAIRSLAKMIGLRRV
ncbi:MAG: serine/threonine-protein phosphatase [Phycisphaerae bacterium]|nr:serine/threonine-protein phosphatase [Phycisphaerae bacterium]